MTRAEYDQERSIKHKPVFSHIDNYVAASRELLSGDLKDFASSKQGQKRLSMPPMHLIVMGNNHRCLATAEAPILFMFDNMIKDLYPKPLWHVKSDRANDKWTITVTYNKKDSSYRTLTFIGYYRYSGPNIPLNAY